MKLNDIKKTLNKPFHPMGADVDAAYDALHANILKRPTKNNIDFLAKRIMHPTSHLDGSKPAQVMMNFFKENAEDIDKATATKLLTAFATKFLSPNNNHPMITKKAKAPSVAAPTKNNEPPFQEATMLQKTYLEMAGELVDMHNSNELGPHYSAGIDVLTESIKSMPEPRNKHIKAAHTAVLQKLNAA